MKPVAKIFPGSIVGHELVTLSASSQKAALYVPMLYCTLQSAKTPVRDPLDSVAHVVPVTVRRSVLFAQL